MKDPARKDEVEASLYAGLEAVRLVAYCCSRTCRRSARASPRARCRVAGDAKWGGRPRWGHLQRASRFAPRPLSSRGSSERRPPERPRVIDAHAHLDDRRFADDLDAVLARASAPESSACSRAPKTSRQASAMCSSRVPPSVRIAVGVHPHRTESWSDCGIGDDRSPRSRRARGRDRRDRYRLSGRSAPQAAQEAAFLAQLALANGLGLPVIVHVRDAGPLARALVDRAGGARGMVHCFSEGPDEVDEWMRRGFAVSFAGPVTYSKNEALRQAAARASAERICVETGRPTSHRRAGAASATSPRSCSKTAAGSGARPVGERGRAGRQVARENARKLFGRAGAEPDPTPWRLTTSKRNEAGEDHAQNPLAQGDPRPVVAAAAACAGGRTSALQPAGRPLSVPEGCVGVSARFHGRARDTAALRRTTTENGSRPSSPTRTAA